MIDVLDLFCGMGGLSIGFSSNGFQVKGYDINPFVPEIFKANKIGTAEIKDLSVETLSSRPFLVVGGPPCKPWSSINITRRGTSHPDYLLLHSFFKNVIQLKPQAFLMENVIPIKKDRLFQTWLKRIQRRYSVCTEIICFADFGAPIARKRLFTFGFKEIDAENFIAHLNSYKKSHKTVGEVIEPFLNMQSMDFPDHEWPLLKTIQKYYSYYETGKYGWYQLQMDKPAPSFGNIMKTYILHPMAGVNGFPLRVISIREAMSIMGFPVNFKFPEHMGKGMRYQMVADAVSPFFSKICAKALKKTLDH